MDFSSIGVGFDLISKLDWILKLDFDEDASNRAIKRKEEMIELVNHDLQINFQMFDSTVYRMHNGPNA